MSSGQAPLVAHVIHHLVIGGLENGLVNLINRIPPQRYRHVVICMADYSDFRDRIQRPDVDVIAMHKKQGQDPATQWRLFKLLRTLKPDILHTRNLTALDALLPAMLAGIHRRLHGEHGRDINDLRGDSRKLQWVRRLHRPMVKGYVTVSKDLENYLTQHVGVASKHITQIYNGVDTERFSPATDGKQALPAGAAFQGEQQVVIGAVGRLQPVKNQMLLAQAFVRMLQRAPELSASARLALVGDGPLREDIAQYLEQSQVNQYCWMPGARQDIPELYRGMDIFVLPSLGEGISNTLLEAMASGLPVVATAVGGNVELVDDGHTGQLVPSGDVEQMSLKLEAYVRDQQLRQQHGAQARQHALDRFSLNAMVDNYLAIYDRMMQQ